MSSTQRTILFLASSLSRSGEVPIGWSSAVRRAALSSTSFAWGTGRTVSTIFQPSGRGTAISPPSNGRFTVGIVTATFLTLLPWVEIADFAAEGPVAPVAEIWVLPHPPIADKGWTTVAAPIAPTAAKKSRREQLESIF